MDEVAQGLSRVPWEGWALGVLMIISVFVGYRHGDRIEQYLEEQEERWNAHPNFDK